MLGIPVVYQQTSNNAVFWDHLPHDLHLEAPTVGHNDTACIIKCTIQHIFTDLAGRGTSIDVNWCRGNFRRFTLDDILLYSSVLRQLEFRSGHNMSVLGEFWNVDCYKSPGPLTSALELIDGAAIPENAEQ